jgi:hypothetical protein
MPIIMSYPTPWIPGKLRGTIEEMGASFRFRCGVKREGAKTFSIKEYGSKESALKAAEEHKRDFNKQRALSANDYRFLNSHTIEVKLNEGYTMWCDIDQLANVQLCTWFIRRDRDAGSSVYVVGSIKKKMIRFHRLVLPCEDDNLTVEHKNGTNYSEFILDNRKSNLKLATAQEQAQNRALLSNNKTGVNGVCHLPKSCSYKVSWMDNGIKRSKLFFYGSRSMKSKDEAFAQAILFRQKKDEETGCNNGKRPCSSLRKRKVDEENSSNPILKKRTKVIEEYFIPNNNYNHNTQYKL